MQKIIIEPTDNSPAVVIDYESGSLTMTGGSSPSNVLTFYEPVFKAVADFKNSSNDSVTGNFEMQYFNTASARCIFLILKELKQLEMSGMKVHVNWQHGENDYDMLETGQDFEILIDLKFNYIAIETDEEDDDDY